MILTPTEAKLQSLVAAKLNLPVSQVPVDEPFHESLGLDSFALMSFILEIEELFAPATISDDAAQRLKTLRDVAALIDQQLGNPSTGAS